jgi:hypothetical protein
LDCTVVATNKNIQLESHGQWIKIEVEWLGSSELVQPCRQQGPHQNCWGYGCLSPPNMVFTATKWSVPNKNIIISFLWDYVYISTYIYIE